MTNSLEAAKNAGFDLSLVEENLCLTPEQRLLQHQLALDMVQQLRSAHHAAAKQQSNDQPQQPLAKTV